MSLDSVKKRLGIVAVVPFWSQSDNLNADSNYAYLRAVLPEMTRQSPDTLFLVFFPDPEYGRDAWRYTPDGLQSERIRFVSWPYDTQMQTSVIGFDPLRFYDIERHYAPTMYWLNQVEMGAQIYSGYTHSWNKAAMPALVAQHHYIVHRSLPYMYEAMFPRQWAQIGGSIASEIVVYNSDYCKKMAQEAFGEYLDRLLLNALDDKSEVLKFGLVKDTDPIGHEAEDDEQACFLYNHRFETYKQPDVTFKLFEELHADYDFKVYATQTAGQKTGGTMRYHFDQSIFEPDRTKYLTKIASLPAINTINSSHETFCIAIMDSISAGHLVVLPNNLTFPELVPDDYPYLFDNVNEQRAMLSSILNSWPSEYNKWRLPLSRHAKQNFGVVNYVNQYLDLMAKVEQQHRTSEKKEHTEQAFYKMFSALKYDKPYSPDDLRKVFARVSTKGTGPQAYPSRRMVREAMSMTSDIVPVWERGVKLVRRKTT
jgi:hypothetical protein